MWKLMSKKKSKLQIAQEKAEESINETNNKIDELGKHTEKLHDALNQIQEQFDAIRNIPSESKLEYERLKKVRLNWKHQAEKIETDYQKAVIKNAGAGAAGATLGVGVVTLGPTAAMGIATTFGVASTGTAISTLSGAAATNAALAWLGGGALAAGGGGMAAGNAVLALAGPVGWAIAGVALLSSGLLFWKAKSEIKRLEDIFTLISERDIKSYELAIVELNERITRICDESELLEDAIKEIQTFGLDYSKMTEAQQYALGSYVNLMSSSTQLLVNPILGLQSKYSESDLEDLLNIDTEKTWTSGQRKIILTLSNLLYRIDVDQKDEKLLLKSFKKNKKFLSALEISKKELDASVFETVSKVLDYKYFNGNA
jgi:septal ring factor EnvC (AmiA/AmiB activator)